MKYIAVLFLAWIYTFPAYQGLYSCKNARISLFSSAPIEDIAASSTSGTSVFNAATGEIAFSVNIASFRFKKSLMQAHFNSEYMESDKYPRASFKGKINERLNVNQNGTYPVTAIGELEVHGIKQTSSFPGIITVNNGSISLSAEFMVKCADHQIEIPKIVFHNIAESIKINVSANYIATK
jgi:hypothetical protein